MFKPEDFYRKMDLSDEYASIATIANRLLIERSTVVYTEKNHGGDKAYWADDKTSFSSHTARIFGITEIEKKVIKEVRLDPELTKLTIEYLKHHPSNQLSKCLRHEAEPISQSDDWHSWTEYKCKHCGVKMKPSFEVVEEWAT